MSIVDGVVLVGDATGHNDPLIGQGLSLALRDVRMLSELLLSDSDWSLSRLAPYAEERRERMRRLRFTASFYATLGSTFGPAAVERRARFFARLRQGDERARMLLAPISLGPDPIPAWAFEEETLVRVF